MRIATFNVNSIKARLTFLLHWLAAREPDIVCLQELKVTEDKFPFAELEQAGYHAYVHAQARWNGVAVLSRQPGKLVQAGLVGAEDAGARLVSAQIGDMLATSVYVPNGKTVEHDDYKVKLDFMTKLNAFARERIDPSSHAFVGGDYNIVHRAIDSHAPGPLEGSIFHTPEERAQIDALLEAGLSDLYRDLHPDGPMFSWWDYRAGSFHKNTGLRIDLVLGTASVRAQCEEVWIDREYRKKKDGETPSDHAPVIVDLR
jgi:exodeoxyribonuclease-3